MKRLKLTFIGCLLVSLFMAAASTGLLDPGGTNPASIYRARTNASGHKPVSKAPLFAQSEETQLYGTMVWKDAWTNMDERPYGVYGFSSADINPAMCFSTVSDALTGVEIDGHYYIVSRLMDQNSVLYEITINCYDTATGNLLSEINIDEPRYSKLPLALTYDESTGLTYALTYSDDNANHVLATIDLSTGVMLPVGVIGAVNDMPSFLTFAMAQGMIYAVASDGNLYSVNPVTAEVSEIGSTGLSPMYIQSAVYDNASATMWWAAALANGEGRLCKLDLTTGAATTVGIFPDNEEFVGLYVKSSASDPSAPAKVSGLTFEPSAPGALSGTLSFTMPSVTNGGAALSGTLDASVVVGDDSAATLHGAPGALVETPITLEEGMNTVSVTVSSGGMASSPAVRTFYAGKDAPAAVTDLQFEVSGDNAVLTWNAPAGGQHGGWCPIDEVSYRIVRSDGTVSAASYSGTEFTETLPQLIGDYSYTVTPFIPGGAEGLPLTSNSLRVGSYYDVPVIFDFNYDSVFNSDFIIHDHNEDGMTWMYNHTWDDKVANACYPASWSNGADDYLVLSGVRLKGATVYRLSFDNSSAYEGVVEKLKVLLGKGVEVEDLTIEIADFPNIIAMPSTHQEILFTVPDDGVYYPAFYIYSDAAQSYFSIDDVRIEELGSAMAPGAASITLAYSGDGITDKVDVTVTAPVKTLGDSQLGEITVINLFRGDTNLPVYTFTSPAPGSTLTWTDETPGNGPVKYRAEARNTYGLGGVSEAELFVGGWEPPFGVTFESPEEFSYFTVLNLNGDDKTWTLENGTAMYSYSLFETADDWLLSPNIRLRSDRVYEVVTTARTGMHKENLAITCGQGTDPAAQNTLLDLQGFCSEQPVLLSSWLKVPSAGLYNIGFHAYSPKNALYIYLDRLEVRDVASIDAPDEVSDLSVSGAADGSLAAVVRFNAPAVTCGGETLTSLQSVEIYRGDSAEPAKVFSNPAAGAPLEWTDSEARQGMAEYRVCAVNAAGRGLVSKASSFVGHDAPAAVNSLRAKGDADNANAVITWEAPSAGRNGGYVDPSTLTYTVSRTYNWETTVIASGLRELTFTDNVGAEGKQSARTYTVLPLSDGGEGLQADVAVALGTLRGFPLVENFASYIEDEWTNVISTNYNASWMVTPEQNGVTSVDPETGFVQFVKWNDVEDLSAGVLATPKVSMAGASRPYLTMWIRHDPAADARAHVRVGYRVNDNDMIELADLYVNAGAEGWTQYSWPLAVTASDFVSAEFHAENYDQNTRIFMDNIAIDDVYDHNLALDALTGPTVIDASGATYTAMVRNKGLLVSGDYDVTLLCNGEPVETKHASALEPRATESFEFVIGTPAAPDGGTERVYQARVDYQPDMKVSDNLSDELKATVLASTYPAVADLSASVADGEVTMTWGEPSVRWSPAVTDSFEDYEPFAISDLGPWTLYDGDGQMTYGIKYGLTFPDWYTPKAWQVWDPMRANLLGEDVAPRTGYMCLMSMGSDGQIPGSDIREEPRNDDWLISEEVAGGSMVTFWLKQPTNNYGGNEAVELLYSATGTEISDFTVLATIELEGMAEWSRHIYTLPADSRYFAIRHHQSFFGLWMDDITYSPVRTAIDLGIEGYNIYRDNELIGTSPTPAFVDAAPGLGVRRYAVATRFNLGEGPLSNVVEVDISNSGADMVTATGLPVITTAPGMVKVTCPTSAEVSIMTPDGRTLRSQQVTGHAAFRVIPGIYVVKAGSVVRKVQVR